MFTETLTEHEDIVGVACEGKLTEDDLKRMHALLHERLSAAENSSLVVDLTDFEGYKSLSALREDLKIDIVHRNDFARVAIIGDQKWTEWGTALVRTLIRAELRWFDSGELNKAIEWARRG